MLATTTHLHITNSHVASIKYHNYALSNIHGLCGCSCNLFDVVSVYSLNPGKLPGRFSYKRPGYEASPDFDIGPNFVYLDSYKRVSSVCIVVLAQILSFWHSSW